MEEKIIRGFEKEYLIDKMRYLINPAYHAKMVHNFKIYAAGYELRNPEMHDYRIRDQIMKAKIVRLTKALGGIAIAIEKDYPDTAEGIRDLLREII